MKLCLVALLVVFGCALVLADFDANKVDIKIKHLDTNNELSLTVNRIETIKSIKFNLQDKLGVPMDRQRLFFGPEMVPLTDDHILETVEAPTIFLKVLQVGA